MLNTRSVTSAIQTFTRIIVEAIIILGFGTAGKFENSRKIRTLAESVEALGVTPISICYLVLTEVETQILNGSAQVRLAGESNLSF